MHRSTLADPGFSVLRAVKRQWHHVYLVRATDGSYYCGYALDPSARLKTHNSGRGAKALRGRRPVNLAYTRRFTSKSDALRFEIELKRRSHAQKRQLSRKWLRARAH